MLGSALRRPHVFERWKPLLSPEWIRYVGHGAANRSGWIQATAARAGIKNAGVERMLRMRRMLCIAPWSPRAPLRTSPEDFFALPARDASRTEASPSGSHKILPRRAVRSLHRARNDPKHAPHPNDPLQNCVPDAC